MFNRRWFLKALGLGAASAALPKLMHAVPSLGAAGLDAKGNVAASIAVDGAKYAMTANEMRALRGRKLVQVADGISGKFKGPMKMTFVDGICAKVEM
jgi:hypothetical protein